MKETWKIKKTLKERLKENALGVILILLAMGLILILLIHILGVFF